MTPGVVSVRTQTGHDTRILLLPAAFTGALAGLASLPSVRENATTQLACLGAAAALALWHIVLAAGVRRRGRPLSVHVEARKQHYVQACAQATIFLYWGWYWPEVYRSAPLILAQLLFAYAFDMLLSWSRRDSYTLGFGPFPVIFSINLFLWFKPDWFHLQFAMVALGFAAKELIGGPGTAGGSTSSIPRHSRSGCSRSGSS
jgi:hypothetical protein